MKILPIEKENLAWIRLDLTRHYLQIDCDFVCYIVLNPSGDIPTGGTDICALHVGAWQIDAFSFLTDKFTKNVPGFSACLCWDVTLVTDMYRAPRVAESDIDTANSISSLKGQPVNITGFSLPEGDGLPVKTYEDQYVNTRYFDFNSGKYLPYLMRKKWLHIRLGSILSNSDLEFFNNYKISDGVYLFPEFAYARKTDITTGLLSVIFKRGHIEGVWTDNSWNPDGSYFKGVLSNGQIAITINDNVVQAIKVTGTAAYIHLNGFYNGEAGTLPIDFTFAEGEDFYIGD